MNNALFILQIITLAAIGGFFYLWQRPFFTVDIRAIAQNMAAGLLADYQSELYYLTEQTVKDYTREKYVQLCQEIGLPLAATDRISSLVWGAIRTAKGEGESPAVQKDFSFYD